MSEEILTLSETVNFEAIDDGEYVVLDPGSFGLMLCDIIISVKHTPSVSNRIPKIYDLIIQIGDGENVFKLFNIDATNSSVVTHSFRALPRFWSGGRIEVLKSFDGEVNIVVNYIKIHSVDYNTWSRK